MKILKRISLIKLKAIWFSLLPVTLQSPFGVQCSHITARPPGRVDKQLKIHALVGLLGPKIIAWALLQKKAFSSLKSTKVTLNTLNSSKQSRLKFDLSLDFIGHISFLNIKNGTYMIRWSVLRVKWCKNI